MTDHSLRVVAKGATGGTVELDGEDISNTVRGLDIQLRVGDIPKVTLDVVVVDLSNETDGAAALIRPETRDLLVKLGWTPPEEDS